MPAAPAPSASAPSASATNPLENKASGWSARFAEPVKESVLRYTASLPFDQRLWRADIAGSLAHAAMLVRQGIISAADGEAIRNGLQSIAAEIENGKFAWRLELEDVHLNIEARLTQLIGEAGGRLHTARSRNDQVATDLRLWLRGEMDTLAGHLRDLIAALLDQAQAHARTIMPGFTHLQAAQPVSLGHHLLAYAEMFGRDHERLLQARVRVNQLPLGAAALAGTSFAIDRESVARDLGFEGVCRNSLDAVSDRDFAIEFLSVSALTMVHVSRLGEEIVLWMSPGFGFIDLPDAYCTGSSIMPQKKNPDVAELARGKSARVIGDLMALLTLMKSQPLAYNKDNQEDKEPLFDAVDTLGATLGILAGLIAGLQARPGPMRRAALAGFASATDLADLLTRSGVPFRQAHETVARAVRLCQESGITLDALTPEQCRALDARLKPEWLAQLTPEAALAARNHTGGAAPEQVLRQVEFLRNRFLSN